MRPKLPNLSPPRTFPDRTKAKTGNVATNRTRGQYETMIAAQKVFVRHHPSHVMESRWALYVNIKRLAALVEAEGKLPRVSLQEAEIKWIPEQSENPPAFKTGAYFVWFFPQIMVGDSEFYPWRFLSENADLDEEYLLGFRHEAPAPIVPWPGCTVTSLEMPPELFSAVKEGMKQAEEALIVYLGKHTASSQCNDAHSSHSDGPVPFRASVVNRSVPGPENPSTPSAPPPFPSS